MAQVDEDEELAHLENPMSRPIEALAEEVLQLPSDARSRLLDRVVASLDRDRARDAAWDALAAHRDAEIESGAAIAVSGPEVVTRLRAELE
jgi:Putative addiction module component